MTKPRKAFGQRRLSFDSDEQRQCEVALSDAGIWTVAQFLNATLTIRDRLQLSARTGISGRDIRDILSRVEFQQLTGFNDRIVTRLRAAGIVSLHDLAVSDPVQLTDELLDASPQWNISRSDLIRLIAIWIAEARELHSVLN